MALEIRILSGALAGQARRFEKPLILIGRQRDCDLRFDAEKDLDVSGRHAELHTIQGRYALHDLNSTNGTFVNGTRLDAGATLEVKHKDRLRFGAAGPETELLTSAGTLDRSVPSTEVRIAMAVQQHTAGLRRLVLAGLVVIVAGTAGAMYYLNQRQSGRRVEELNQLVRANDSMRVQLQNSLARSGDTTLMNGMQRRMDSLRTRLAGAATDDERGRLRDAIRETEQQLRRISQMDLPTIFARNSRAVAIMVSEMGGTPFAGSAFAITPDGLLVTNKHNVVDAQGRRPTRIAVKFTDTRDWLPARVAKVSDAEDLALIQMERGGPYPVVEGIGRGTGDAAEGMSVAVIGYPSGMDTPMEGTGNDFEAKSTLSPGTVSKKTSSVLQIDSFATHGSSGSPVFSTRGYVIGVVFGGAAEAGGKIVYAVPAERLSAFIPDEYRSILRD